MGKGGNGFAIHQGCDFETGNSKIEIETEIRGRKPFFPLAHFPASFTRSLNDSMIQSPDGPILLFSLCPFSPFPVSPSSLFPFLSSPSAPWLLPPRPPSRGSPPLPGDCTPWPLGRRGRSSCKGTLQSNAPPSTARPGLPIDDCRLTIVQSRGPGLGARASGFGSRQFWILDF